MSQGRSQKALLLLVVPCVLTACAPAFESWSPLSNQAAQEPSDSAPPAEPELVITKARWEDARPESRSWTEFAFAQLEIDGPDLLAKIPNDIENFCPNYQNLSRGQRKNFWVYLLSAIAHFESAYNPETQFTESFVDANGNRVISRGLLQLSFESARGYDCILQKAEDLHRPTNNLACGIRILNRWVGRDGVIRANSEGWKGGARYWSVLRRDAQFNSIRGWTAAQSYCQRAQ